MNIDFLSESIRNMMDMLDERMNESFVALEFWKDIDPDVDDKIKNHIEELKEIITFGIGVMSEQRKVLDRIGYELKKSK